MSFFQNFWKERQNFKRKYSFSKPPGGLLGFRFKTSNTPAFIEKKNDLVSSILVGNNFVNILASALATAILIKFYGDDGVIYSTIVMSILIVIFAEILPKNIALLKPDRYALTLSFILTLFLKIFSPFVYIIKKFNLLIFKIIKHSLE